VNLSELYQKLRKQLHDDCVEQTRWLDTGYAHWSPSQQAETITRRINEMTNTELFERLGQLEDE